MKSSVLLAIVSAIVMTLLAVPANAQATRTWVSGVGDDANPCSRTAPCKTFAGAISKTSSPGEINCLDPAGFGAVTITKAITIKCDAVSNGGVLVSGTNGIVVNIPTGGVVYLSGLDFEGLGTGLNGVSILAASTVYVINSSIRNFVTSGVNVSTSLTTRVVIQNSIIENNGTNGTLNTGGIVVNAGGSSSNGVDAINTLIDGNQNFGAQATGANSSVGFAGSQLIGSPVAINLVNGAKGILIGPSNTVVGTINGTTTSLPLK